MRLPLGYDEAPATKRSAPYTTGLMRDFPMCTSFQARPSLDTRIWPAAVSPLPPPPTTTNWFFAHTADMRLLESSPPGCSHSAVISHVLPSVEIMRRPPYP